MTTYCLTSSKTISTAWTPSLHKGSRLTFPNLAVLGGIKKIAWKGGMEEIGIKLEMEGLKKFSLVCGLVGSILYENFKQNDYFLH